MSIVWKFFSRLPNDAAKAKCNLCGELRSLGSKERSKQTTSGLLSHLQASHKQALKKAEDDASEAKAKEESALKQKVERIAHSQQQQLRINEVSPEIHITQKWADHDPRSLLLDDKIFQMIITDLQPWTMVEDEGFQAMLQTASPQYRLKTEKFYRSRLDSFYKEQFDLVKLILKPIQFLSFTCDHWTNDANVVCLMSLTVVPPPVAPVPPPVHPPPPVPLHPVQPHLPQFLLLQFPTKRESGSLNLF